MHRDARCHYRCGDLDCAHLLRRWGLDIGDTVVIVLEGGTLLIGELVATEERFLRIRTTGGVVPPNVLLTVDCDEIAAIGELP